MACTTVRNIFHGMYFLHHGYFMACIIFHEEDLLLSWEFHGMHHKDILFLDISFGRVYLLEKIMVISLCSNSLHTNHGVLIEDEFPVKNPNCIFHGIFMIIMVDS